MKTPYCQLTHAFLHRFPTPGVIERFSSDFVVNGKPLLALLEARYGASSDFMGCFVRGFPEPGAEVLHELLPEIASCTANRRVGIYICPECGDTGCGSFSVRVAREENEFVWSEFAYENGYNEPRIFDKLGPFRFHVTEYEHALEQAAQP